MFCRVSRCFEIAGKSETNPVWFLDFLLRRKSDQHDVELADVLDQLGARAIVCGAVEGQDIGIEISEAFNPNHTRLAAGEAEGDLFVFVQLLFEILDV